MQAGKLVRVRVFIIIIMKELRRELRIMISVIISAKKRQRKVDGFASRGRKNQR